jgi:DNA-binding transcriptional MerR regulator
MAGEQKRFVTHSQKAAQWSVSTRTVDRWVATGILPPPTYINGRKYHHADAAPRHDRTNADADAA